MLALLTTIITRTFSCIYKIPRLLECYVKTLF